MQQMRVAIVTQDVIGERLAGPAIRALAIGRVLSGAGHDVRVHSAHGADHPSELVVPGALDGPGSVALARWADVLVVQGDVLPRGSALGKGHGTVVCDLYDPVQMEGLVQAVHMAPYGRYLATRTALEVLTAQLERGDLFLCASERQRLFWLGHLDAAGRVNPATYDRDPSLSDLLAVVPFGIEEDPPVQDGIGLRGRVAGLEASSRVVLWGGGVYDWLDPLPVIEAVAGLATEIPELRLVFMGTTHPNPAVPASSMLTRARSLVQRLQAEHVVLFHEGWVPYGQRHNVLLDAEVGVSGHPDHIETMLAYRTRILDYVWAGLPVVTTAGDALGDLVDERGLGRIVPPGDPAAVAAALRDLLLDPNESAAVREHLAQAAPSMRWSAVLTPLIDHCARPRPAADRDVPAAQQLHRVRAPRGYGRVERAREVIASGRASLEQDGPGGLARKVGGRLLRRPPV